MPGRGRLPLDRGRELHGLTGGLVEPALADHAVEDVVPAGRDVLEVLGCDLGVVDRGTADDRGEDGRLLDGEVLGGLAVVGLGRGLDAVGAASVVDGVEVVLEDLLLALLLVDLDREQDLLVLAGERAVRGQEVVLDVLLGDRGATLGGPATLDRDDDRPQHALGGHTVLLVEAAVLGRQHRLADVLGQVGDVDRLPVDLGDALQFGLAVGVVDDRGLRGRNVIGLGRLDRRVGDADEEQAEHSDR